MLAALLGTEPLQHWEQTTVYTQHAISTPKPPPETGRVEALSPFTLAHRSMGALGPPPLAETSSCVPGFFLTSITTSAQHITLR